VTKPIANQIKETAQRNKSFRDACIGFGKTVNRMTMRLQLRSMNVEVKEIKSKLDEQQAIKRASEALSELFVFGVFGTVVVGQSYYANKMEQEKEEEESRYQEQTEMKIAELNRKVTELSRELERLGGVVNENRDSLHNLSAEEKRNGYMNSSSDVLISPSDRGDDSSSNSGRWWWW